ncbi:MAG TPA: 3-oxoacyl-[acyl-carrier-protein] reductase [Geobacteraceae bacterium]
MRLEGKVALITGASRGIGKAVALCLAEAGADLVVTATTLAAAESTAAEIVKLGRRALPFAADIGETGDVEALFTAALAEFGRIDILVNNAGITRDGLLMRMKVEDWQAVIDTNLKGAFLCTKEAAKVMTKARWGRIINITSVVGQMGNAGQANYCASKAGMIGLTKSAARELAKRNVTVNAVAPGFVATDMTEVLSDKVKEQLLQQIPLERLGSVDDIAHAVRYLATDEAGYITGQVLAVNGGMYM